ncbi:MAG: FAD-binding protein, partial [Pseudomonadota bacterium]|nr:FAD-binding protein [Pseudomonadota bacterium]
TDPLRPPAPNPNITAVGAKVYKAATLQELAATVSLPYDRLAETVSAYNAALSEGALDRLTPPRVSHLHEPYPISKPPFYAIPVCAGLSYTMGGPEIDAHGRVLDREDRPIQGLYAAGSTSGGLEGGPFAGYVGGLIKALISGLLAADCIARTMQPAGALL